MCGRGFHTRTLFRSHRCKPKPELTESKTSDGQLTDVKPSEGQMMTAESAIAEKPVNGDINALLTKGMGNITCSAVILLLLVLLLLLIIINIIILVL